MVTRDCQHQADARRWLSKEANPKGLGLFPHDRVAFSLMYARYRVLIAPCPVQK